MRRSVRLLPLAILVFLLVAMVVPVGCSKKKKRPFFSTGGGGVPGQPYISSIKPASGYCGTEVTIYGHDFCDTPGQVVFSIGMDAPIISWSDGEIRCTIPMGAVPGPVYVTNTESEKSNEVFFDVTGSGGAGGLDPGGTATGLLPTGGSPHNKYKIYIPTGYDPETPIPLFTLNDTHSQWETIWAGTTGRGWKYIAEQTNVIIAAWDLNNTTGNPIDSQCKDIISGIEDIKALYNIDLKRIYFSGCCRFARMVLKWTLYRPDYFAAGHIDSCTGELDGNAGDWTGRKMPVYIVEPSGHMPDDAADVTNSLKSHEWEVVLERCSMSKPYYEEALLVSMEWIIQKENPTPGGGMP